MTGMSRRTAVAVAAAVAMLAAACDITPPRQQFAEFTYMHLEPIGLDVADIVVEQDYRPPLHAPSVDHEFPLSPAEAARRWAQDRLRAVGNRGRATFTIVDAPVKEVQLETEGGLSGLFTTEPAQRYEARLEIRMTIERPEDSGELTVHAERTASVPEGASLNERETIWHGLVEKLMADVNTRLETTLREDWARFVRG